MLLKDFMFDSVYTNPMCKGEEARPRRLRMNEHYRRNPDACPRIFRTSGCGGIQLCHSATTSCMTDVFAVEKFKELFLPMNRTVRVNQGPHRRRRRGKRRKFAGPQARISEGRVSAPPRGYLNKGLPWGLSHGKRHDGRICR